MNNKEEIPNHADTEAVLQQYALHVQYIEDLGRVKKIYSDRGVFALKTISPHVGIDFIRNIQTLYKRGYNRIVPIYQTIDGRYAVLYHNKLHYLMPWLDNEQISEREVQHKQMFRELARMHTISVKEIEVDKEDREAHYERTLQLWEADQQFLEEWIVSCERRWYMSPMEMMFCFYYNDLSQAVNYSIKKFKEWYEKTKDEEKIRTVVTHGKPSVKHFVNDHRGYGYFINFENSSVAPPHFDLLPFIVKSTKTYPIQCDECVDRLYYYLRYFPLKEDEMLLMQSYLAFPSSAIETVRKYVEKRSDKTELDSVKELQRQYWFLKNIEYVVMKVEERENQKKAAANEQSQ